MYMSRGHQFGQFGRGSDETFLLNYFVVGPAVLEEMSFNDFSSFIAQMLWN